MFADDHKALSPAKPLVDLAKEADRDRDPAIQDLIRAAAISASLNGNAQLIGVVREILEPIATEKLLKGCPLRETPASFCRRRLAGSRKDPLRGVNKTVRPMPPRALMASIGRADRLGPFVRPYVRV